MTKTIQLTQGKTALVDDEWFDALNARKWWAFFDGSNWYAIRKGLLRETVYMHRVVAGARKGEFVDHKDGNGLNNTAGNLRACSHAENNRHKKLQKNSTTGYKGVTFDKSKYRAHICFEGKDITIGRYFTPEEAARAYDRKAKELFGPFAWLNFPDSPSQ